jgi:hypothetical protein
MTSAGFGAAIGLNCGRDGPQWVKKGTPAHHDAAAARKAAPLSQIIQKSSKSLLTPGRPPDYIRLNNEGGAPLATKEFALVLRNQESRVSDTRPAPKPKAEWATTLRLQVSVL